MAYIMREKVPEDDPVNIPEQREIIDNILDKYVGVPGAPMIVLNQLQSNIGYISKPMQIYVAEKLNVSSADIHGVVSFYSFFSTSPKGKHTIKFCMGTACYVGGAPQLIERTRQELNINIDQTTEDGEISLELCRCVGACSQAPVVVVDDEVHGRVNPGRIPTIIRSIYKKE